MAAVVAGCRKALVNARWAIALLSFTNGSRKHSSEVEIQHCKKGVVMTTNSLLFQIQMSEHNSLLCGG